MDGCSVVMGGCGVVSETNGSFQYQTSAEDVPGPRSVACFEEAVASALAALGSSGLQLKEEQKCARAVYEAKDVCVLADWIWGKSLLPGTPFCRLVLDHLRGPKKSSAVLLLLLL